MSMLGAPPYSHMPRPPALRTPSPPRTPVALRHTVRPRLFDEEAFFHAQRSEPPHSAVNHALTAMSRPDHLVPWFQPPPFRVPLPLRPPAIAALSLPRVTAVEAPVSRRLAAQGAAVGLLPSPSSPTVFRPQLPPHMRVDKHDGGRAAVTSAAPGPVTDSANYNISSNEHEAQNHSAVEVSGGVNEEQQQRHLELEQDNQPSTTLQTVPQAESSQVDQPSDKKTEAEAGVEQVVKSTADIERALADCKDEQPAADEKNNAPEQEAEEVEKDDQQATQQPDSPIIDIIELDGESEKRDEAETRVQSEADSAVSSHYAFVGPAKFDGSPVVRQLLIDNGIHIVEFDDERCNIAFVESDYTPEQLSTEPIPAGKEEDISFYDMQFIRDTVVGSAKELSVYRLTKPSERS